MHFGFTGRETEMRSDEHRWTFDSETHATVHETVPHGYVHIGLQPQVQGTRNRGYILCSKCTPKGAFHSHAHRLCNHMLYNFSNHVYTSRTRWIEGKTYENHRVNMPLSVFHLKSVRKPSSLVAERVLNSFWVIPSG